MPRPKRFMPLAVRVKKFGYELIQVMMERLCYGMLFYKNAEGTRMSATQILERVIKIETELANITQPATASN